MFFLNSVFQSNVTENGAVRGTVTCTKPLYALYYQANTCLNINTKGWYELDGKNGYLTYYQAVYVNSYVASSDGISSFNNYYNHIDSCS